MTERRLFSIEDAARGSGVRLFFPLTPPLRGQTALWLVEAVAGGLCNVPSAGGCHSRHRMA